MKPLKELLYKVRIDAISGQTDLDIALVAFDSRSCSKGSLFVAIKGGAVDGHTHIASAIENGAQAIVCQEMPKARKEEVTYIQVENAREALAIMAANWYDHPSKSMKVVGVTGTNGKTSVTTMLHETVTGLGFQAGLISTIKICYGETVVQATHTTPDPLSIQFHLAQMREQGVAFCFMEVSSHGIDQERHLGIEFAGAVFTNLSHDHLDYHKTFANYRDVKKRLFDALDPQAFALANSDDKNAKYMLQNTKGRPFFYGLKVFSDFKAQVLETQFAGMQLRIEDRELYAPFHGAFNASNLLAVYAVCVLLDFDVEEVLVALSQLKPVEGRFNLIKGSEGVHAIVDFAHTPDALTNVYQAIEELRTRNERLITVVGCGGNRDQDKRPEMGKIAAQASDTVVFTSDNPRDEDPMAIIDQMNAGVAVEHTQKVLIQPDRYQAIKMAMRMAQPNDIVLIAGKGHERYQEIRGERMEFDDVKTVKELINA